MYAKLLDHLAPDNLPAGEMICDTGIQRTAELRQTTARELLHLGTRQVVYLKAGTCDGEIFFVICGADGTPIARAEDLETAMRMACARTFYRLARARVGNGRSPGNQAAGS